jgi:3-hydroxyisobutyrate dehydrogenase
MRSTIGSSTASSAARRRGRPQRNDVTATIGFFGIGAMGFAMAGRLARAGYAVAVSDPATGRADAWRERFGAASHMPDAAEIIITCVSDAAALDALLLGRDGLVASARPGTLFIDHTTASPVLARQVAAAAAARSADALDAPVSGGGNGAELGTLSVMAGGTVATLARAEPLLACYASRVTHLGASGAGQLAKLANQVAIAGAVRGLAEALALADAAGLDGQALLRALAAGTAGSVQLDRLAATIGEHPRSFAQRYGWLRKDLDLALAEATRLEAILPLAALVCDMLDEQ